MKAIYLEGYVGQLDLLYAVFLELKQELEHKV
jgi:hypothetical protein